MTKGQHGITKSKIKKPASEKGKKNPAEIFMRQRSSRVQSKEGKGRDARAKKYKSIRLLI